MLDQNWNEDPVSLSGKTILITGAAQGIGRAIAELSLSLGANVAAVDLNEGALKSLHEQFGNERVQSIVGNVSDADFARQCVDSVVARFGGINGLVNNAGIIRPAMIEKMKVEDWRQVIDVHLSGAFYFLQAAGTHMIEWSRRSNTKAQFSIINISSDAGRRGTIGQINYGAAKAGVLGLTMCAAREWAKYNIRVNTVGFGVVETQMTETIRSEKFAELYQSQIPLDRFAKPIEVARPVCFLLSDAASYITGQHLSVNGGLTISV